MSVEVDPDLVGAICRAAASITGAQVGSVGVAVDPLDATVWVHLPSPAAVTAAVIGLRERGLDTAKVNDHRVHVIGWNVHLLRWRLRVLLAAVDDLTVTEDLTTDLVCYHHDRRVSAGGEVEPWLVLADVEATSRAVVPLPDPAPPGRAPRKSSARSLLRPKPTNGCSPLTSTGPNRSWRSSPHPPTAIGTSNANQPAGPLD